MADHRKLSVTPIDDRPVVALCAGKGCRKRCEFAEVRKVLDRDCDVIELKCIGLCNGPVVVAQPDTDSPVVYAKLRSKRDRGLLVGLASGDAQARRKLSSRKVDKKKSVTAVTRQLRRRVA